MYLEISLLLVCEEKQLLNPEMMFDTSRSILNKES